MNPKNDPVAQAILAGVLFLTFLVVMIVPAFNKDFTVDEAMKQTLITLVVLAASWYFGSSKDSAKKNETIAAQARAVAAQAENTADGALTGGTPAGTPADPVSVTEVPAAAPRSPPKVVPQPVLPDPIMNTPEARVVMALNPTATPDQVRAAVAAARGSAMANTGRTVDIPT